MSRTLQPEDSISHYRIVGPLGAGGMGEVYLAHDNTLERQVALKILPPDLVKNEDRVRRFILEAKSASSLSHPHIVTIYEIGRDVVTPAGGEADSVSGEPVHYIAMELIKGDSLQDKIHREKTDLKSLLTYLAQAAEGLAKAHAAGIIHRDLKPGNVMVTKDGYAKVLDFGLAKLTDIQEAGPDATSAPTEVGDLTGGGVILGTFGYMSPEQVKGKSVDARSDIFSFGCMLYEAATRTKPFAGDTSVDTMHKILHEQPVPAERIDPTIPSDVRRLIRRCLAKSPDQRSQSIKDVAIDLREIVDDYENLSASATSSSGVVPALPERSLTRRPGLMAGIAAAVVIGVAGIAFGIYGWMGSRASGPALEESFQSMRMNSLMSGDEIQQAVLSGDGRYLAYTKRSGEEWTLWVRQVATGSDVDILPPQKESIRGISFSPDGNYLYYLGRDPQTPNYSALFEVPSLGGASTKKTFDVDSAVEFSPDGRRIAFVRGLFDSGTALIVQELGSGSERTLATIQLPSTLPFLRPAWSPDGSSIAAVVQTQSEGLRSQVTVFAADDGTARAVGPDEWPIINSLAWLPGGDGLVVTALDFAGSLSNQVMSLGYPDGRVRRITNDLNQYREMSLSSDGQVLAVMRDSQIPNIWTASPRGEGQPAQVTFSSGSEDGIGGLQALGDRVLFTARKDRGRQIFEIRADGSGRRQITPGPGIVTSFRLHRETGTIVFNSIGDDVIGHIYRIDLDGGNLRQLTSGVGEWLQDLSPDGRTLLFVRWDEPRTLWSLPVEGGDPKPIADDCRGSNEFSPDGRYVSCSTLVEQGERSVTARTVFPAGGGERLATLLTPPRTGTIAWAPDSEALTYMTVPQDEAQEIVRRPIDGGPESVVLRLPGERATTYGWSRDGGSILYVAISGKSTNLRRLEVAGGEPRRLSDFRTGRIFDVREDPDSGDVYFTQGPVSRDVILIRDFR